VKQTSSEDRKEEVSLSVRRLICRAAPRHKTQQERAGDVNFKGIGANTSLSGQPSLPRENEDGKHTFPAHSS